MRSVEDALQRLDKWTQEEARMAEVEILTITHRVDENVEGIKDKLQSTQTDVQGVGHEVGLINIGDLSSSLAPHASSDLLA